MFLTTSRALGVSALPWIQGILYLNVMHKSCGCTPTHIQNAKTNKKQTLYFAGGGTSPSHTLSLAVATWCSPLLPLQLTAWLRSLIVQPNHISLLDMPTLELTLDCLITPPMIWTSPQGSVINFLSQTPIQASIPCFAVLENSNSLSGPHITVSLN